MTRNKTGKILIAGGTPTVNLLPPKEAEKRAVKALQTRWVLGFITTLVVIAAEVVIGASWTGWAERERASAERDSAQLQAQLAQYSEIIGVQAELSSLESLRGQAASNDQTWRPLVAEIKSALPDAVGLVGFKLAPGASPVAGGDASAQVGLRGTLTFSARTTAAQAATIKQLRTIRGFTAVDAGQLTSDGPGGGFTFVATFSADQTRYTGQFEKSRIK